MPTSASTPAPTLAAMLLADGRLPTGGHVHSAGVESAVADVRLPVGGHVRSLVGGERPMTSRAPLG